MMIDEKIVPNNNSQFITGERLNDTLHAMLTAIDERKQDKSIYYAEYGADEWEAVKEAHGRGDLVCAMRRMSKPVGYQDYRLWLVSFSSRNGTCVFAGYDGDYIVTAVLNGDGWSWDNRDIIGDIENLEYEVGQKQDAIADLDAIRTGAGKGDTAVQPATLAEGLAEKQDIISDLDEIREGAGLGATALQSVPEGYATDAEVATAVGAEAERAQGVEAGLQTALAGKADADDIPDVVDSLTSTSATDALSAKQGKVLHTEVTELEQEVGELTELETTEKSNLVGAINEVKESIPSPITLDDDVTKTSANGVKSSGIYSAIHPANGSSQPAGGMLPNVLYNLGELSGSVTIAFATPADNTIANHYFFTFSTGATAPSVTFPASITSWMGGSAPTINANKHYEISVLGGVGVAMEV